MARAATFPSIPAGHRRGRRTLRSERIIATRAVAESLVSLAGLQRRPVSNQAGDETGRLVDVVAR